MRFTVRFKGCGVIRTCRVNIKPTTVIDDETGETAEEYYGGHHNYDGLRGAAVERAVEKTYGKRAFWFGECDCLSRGQVFEALRPTQRNSNPGNSAVTPTIVLDVEEGW